jgi:cobalt/nickel transport system permease protein
MHIPDGFLTGPALAAGWAVGGIGIAACLRMAGREHRERDLPIAGLAAAFFLVGDAPIFPVGIGTQGHLLGGLLAVALLGPWLGAVTIAVVAAIQAIALGDGGITTLGLEFVNLALVPALLGYPLALALRRALPQTPTGLAVACGSAAWVSVVVASVLFWAEFALGARVPIDLSAIAGATIGTYALIGIVEGVLTALIVRALLGVRPDLVRLAAPMRADREEQAIARLQERAA